MIRIISGCFKGRRLKAAPSSVTRPTSDRVREALFSTIGSLGHSFEGTQILDLCAGSGALGFEALSRGAELCLFVEKNRQACLLIAENGVQLSPSLSFGILQGDALHLKSRATPQLSKKIHMTQERIRTTILSTAFDLVFLDPPYEKNLASPILSAVAKGSWLREGALCIIEESSRVSLDIPDGFVLLTQRCYGITQISYLLWKAKERAKNEIL